MRKLLLSTLFLSLAITGFTQEESATIQNSAQKLLEQDGKLMIGGYGEVHYNQGLNSDTRSTGKLDVHRMVMLFGYNFNSRTKFVTELEFEHVKEVYVEQAFMQYKFNNFVNLRGGLLLIPMGITNEYHEPTTFNGVERPLIDGAISPTTWREIGFGISGNIIPASLKYQAYMVNGFLSFNGAGTLRGQDAFRKGRQKGAESVISSPNFTAKAEYYGLRSLNLGVSTYIGNTQSTAYNGVSKDDDAAIASADSTVVGIAMVGIDVRYNISALQLKGQLYYTSVSNTDQYNQKTGSDIGSSLTGLYIEAGYNVLSLTDIAETEAIPFIRYSTFNTHNTVDGGLAKNPSYNKTAITYGLTLKLAQGAVFKADFQHVKSEAANKYDLVFNAGVGVMF